MGRYHFRVTTADEAGAGTDSNIFVILYGESGQTQEVRLNGYIQGNAFERARTDMFDVPLEAVGRLYKIRVRSDCRFLASAWRLSSIEVVSLEPPQPPALFTYEDWISDTAPREIWAWGWRFEYEGRVRSKVTTRVISATDLLDTDQSVQQEYTAKYTLPDQVQFSSEVHDTATLQTATKWESPSKILGSELGKLSTDVRQMWQHEIDSKRIDTKTWQQEVSDKKSVTFPARKLTLVMVEWTEPYTAVVARLGSTSLGLKSLDALPSPVGWTVKSLSVGDEIGPPFKAWLEANRPDLLAKLRKPLPIQYCHYLVRPGDTWDAIAARLLGNAKRAGEIKTANRSTAAPQAGKRLAIPWPAGEILYTVKRGDGFWAVARAAYGRADATLVATVQEWNGGAGHTLARGEIVYCPAQAAPA